MLYARLFVPFAKAAKDAVTPPKKLSFISSITASITLQSQLFCSVLTKGTCKAKKIKAGRIVISFFFFFDTRLLGEILEQNGHRFDK